MFEAKNNNNNFFKTILANGYSLDIKMISAYNIKLKEYGEYLYDHIILFCTSDPGKTLLFFVLNAFFRSQIKSLNIS